MRMRVWNENMRKEREYEKGEYEKGEYEKEYEKESMRMRV